MPDLYRSDDEKTTQCIELVEQLLDLAVDRHHDHQSGDTFEQCHMCGKWEDHDDSCPVPALNRWMMTPDHRGK